MKRRQGEDEKRRRSKPKAKAKPPQIVVVNLAEMGPKPEWTEVVGVLGSLHERQVAVLLWWWTFHLAGARADHEAEAMAPAPFRDHCSGRAAAVARLIEEFRAFTTHEGEKAGPALMQYFGGKKPLQEGETGGL